MRRYRYPECTQTFYFSSFGKILICEIEEAPAIYMYTHTQTYTYEYLCLISVFIWCIFVGPIESEPWKSGVFSGLLLCIFVSLSFYQNVK